MAIGLDQKLAATTLRIAGVANESIVDGPGIRDTIFFQGCPHACPGCHNPETWETGGGNEISILDLLSLLIINPLVTGVTFSGGEPFLQASAAAALGGIFKEKGLDLWVYTGFTWEDLLVNTEKPGFKELLKIADVIVDGPFRKELKDNSIKFIGSSNQRLINVKISLETGRIVQWLPT